MTVGERTKPDLRAVPDTCGVWHVQGCTARGLDWLADEVWGQPNRTAIVVLDEYVAELVEGARDAGLILELLDGPPLQPPDPPRSVGTDRRQGLSMEISDETVELLLELLRRQVEEVDNLVRYLTSIVTAQVGDLVQDRRRDFAKDVGSPVRASMMAQPCFLAVEKNERMSAKSTAPSTERKPPEIFWRNFIMRPSRSA
jgi:hypothetical protein